MYCVEENINIKNLYTMFFINSVTVCVNILQWTLDNPGYLTLEPFCVQPAMFQLLEGEEISLKVVIGIGF